MPAAARPYDFNDFEDAPEPASEPAYAQADIDAAREAGRAEALESRLAHEAAEQTRRCAALAERLEAVASERNDALAAQSVALIAIARDIVKEVCVGAAAHDKGEAALALLERYLMSAPDRAPARLAVCDTTPKPVIAELEKAIDQRGAAGILTVESSSDFAPGDCRIIWRDGAMTRGLEDMLAQIDAIFAGIETDEASKRSSNRPAANPSVHIDAPSSPIHGGGGAEGDGGG